MSAVTLKHDAVFHVLLGADKRVIQEANRRSAARIAQTLQSNTAYALVQQAEQSVTAAQAVFIVFLHVDVELKREVLAGGALSVRTLPLCEYKASRLFECLYEDVISKWTRTELNTALDLVSDFREQYLVN